MIPSSLRPPREHPNYALPIRSRKLAPEELQTFRSLAVTGLYSPLELAQAFELSRALAFRLFWQAIDPRKHATPKRHALPA